MDIQLVAEFYLSIASAYPKAAPRQNAFQQYLDKFPWEIDMETGIVSFGDSLDLTFEIQLLGTHSRISNTWLWGWANSSPSRDTWHPSILEAVNSLRRLGGIFDISVISLDALTSMINNIDNSEVRRILCQ